MDLLETIITQCPYCFEQVEILVDCSVMKQEYVEDCQVCYRPIMIFVSIDNNNKPQIEVSREDE
jgi:hypothetical protein